MIDRQNATLATERLEFIDSLRGFALFGVFWANLLIFSGIDYLTDQQRAAFFPSRFDSIAFFLERFLIENKFMGLFSFLFGIGLGIVTERARARGVALQPFLLRRYGVLLGIGFVHLLLIWDGDILTTPSPLWC